MVFPKIPSESEIVMQMGGRELTLTVPVVEQSWDTLHGGELVVVGVDSVKVVHGVDHGNDRVMVEGADGTLDVFPADFFDKNGFWTVVTADGWWTK